MDWHAGGSKNGHVNHKESGTSKTENRARTRTRGEQPSRRSTSRDSLDSVSSTKSNSSTNGHVGGGPTSAKTNRKDKPNRGPASAAGFGSFVNTNSPHESGHDGEDHHHDYSNANGGNSSGSGNLPWVPVHVPGPASAGHAHALQTQIEMLDRRLNQQTPTLLLMLLNNWSTQAKTASALKEFLLLLSRDAGQTPIGGNATPDTRKAYEMIQHNPILFARNMVLSHLPDLIGWIELRLSCSASIRALSQHAVLNDVGPLSKEISTLRPMSETVMWKMFQQSQTSPPSNRIGAAADQDSDSSDNDTGKRTKAPIDDAPLSSVHICQRIQLLDADQSDQIPSIPILIDPEEFFARLFQNVARKALMWLFSETDAVVSKASSSALSASASATSNHLAMFDTEAGTEHMDAVLFETIKGTEPVQLFDKERQWTIARHQMKKDSKHYPELHKNLLHRHRLLERAVELIGSQLQKDRLRRELVHKLIQTQHREVKESVTRTIRQNDLKLLVMELKAVQEKALAREEQLVKELEKMNVCMLQQQEGHKRIFEPLVQVLASLKDKIKAWNLSNNNNNNNNTANVTGGSPNGTSTNATAHVPVQSGGAAAGVGIQQYHPQHYPPQAGFPNYGYSGGFKYQSNVPNNGPVWMTANGPLSSSLGSGYPMSQPQQQQYYQHPPAGFPVVNPAATAGNPGLNPAAQQHTVPSSTTPGLGSGPASGPGTAPGLAPVSASAAASIAGPAMPVQQAGAISRTLQDYQNLLNKPSK